MGIIEIIFDNLFFVIMAIFGLRIVQKAKSTKGKLSKTPLRKGLMGSGKTFHELQTHFKTALSDENLKKYYTVKSTPQNKTIVLNNPSLTTPTYPGISLLIAVAIIGGLVFGAYQLERVYKEYGGITITEDSIEFNKYPEEQVEEKDIENTEPLSILHDQQKVDTIEHTMNGIARNYLEVAIDTKSPINEDEAAQRTIENTIQKMSKSINQDIAYQLWTDIDTGHFFIKLWVEGENKYFCLDESTPLNNANINFYDDGNFSNLNDCRGIEY